MGMFDIIDLRKPPDSFLEKLDRSFFSIPKTWNSQIGEETLDLLEMLVDGSFCGSRAWRDTYWCRKSLPRMTWDQIAQCFEIAKEYVLELETYGIVFRKQGGRYTIRQFLLQDWKDRQHPWSVFLLCCFGTEQDGRVPCKPYRKLAQYILQLKQKPVNVEEKEGISDSLFEDE